MTFLMALEFLRMYINTIDLAMWFSPIDYLSLKGSPDGWRDGTVPEWIGTLRKNSKFRKDSKGNWKKTRRCGLSEFNVWVRRTGSLVGLRTAGTLMKYQQQIVLRPLRRDDTNLRIAICCSCCCHILEIRSQQQLR